MLPILAGLLTAVCYAISTLASSRASRITGAAPSVAGVMIVGTVLLLPIALVGSPPPQAGTVTLDAVAWSALAGAANVGGLLLAFAAFRIGAVGIVATIDSTEGAIAAVLSVFAGQALAPGSAPALAVIAVGVALAATGGGHELEEGVRISRSQSLRAAGLAIVAASLFGTGLFITGSIGERLAPAWVILTSRIVGLVLVALPLMAMGRLRISHAAVPFVVITGTTEVVGLMSIAAFARLDLAVVAVLTSMFAPIAAIAAFVLFKERLARRQILGIVFVVVGIATLGWLTG